MCDHVFFRSVILCFILLYHFISIETLIVYANTKTIRQSVSDCCNHLSNFIKKLEDVTDIDPPNLSKNPPNSFKNPPNPLDITTALRRELKRTESRAQLWSGWGRSDAMGPESRNSDTIMCFGKTGPFQFAKRHRYTPLYITLRHIPPQQAAGQREVSQPSANTNRSREIKDWGRRDKGRQQQKKNPKNKKNKK